ncbi:MAG: NAD-dependent epimerase/dehydratase family protein [Planctomycetota bacterium]
MDVGGIPLRLPRDSSLRGTPHTHAVQFMRVAVAGASSFIGRHLLPALGNRGLHAVALLRSARKPPTLPSPQEGEGVRAGNENRIVDYNIVDSLRKGMEGCDAIIHLAGLTNGSDEDLHDANVGATRRLMGALPESVRRVVYVSSAAAAMGKGLYGDLKRQSEEIVKGCGREWVILRPTLVVGAGDTKNVAMMKRWVERSPVVPVLGGGAFKVQPVSVKDLVGAVIESLTRPVAGETFNVCGPEQISLRSMLEILKTRSNSRCLFLPIPLKPVQKGLKLWSLIWPRTTLPVKQVSELDKHEAFDFLRTRELLGFNPRRFEESLEGI